MLNYLKKIFSIFLIFNLTFVSSAQAATTFVDSFDVSTQDATPRGLAFNNDGTKMFVVGDTCLLYTSPSPRDRLLSRMPSSA